MVVENKEVDHSRCNLHTVLNIPFHNFSFNPTNGRPVVKDFTLKESISHGLLLKSKEESSGGACDYSNPWDFKGTFAIFIHVVI